MSAHRLTHNVLRNSHRYGLLHQAPVQAQNEPHNEEQNETGKFAEPILPYINVVPHRSDATHFIASLVGPPPWPIPNVPDGDSALKRRLLEFRSSGINLAVFQKKNTAEVSVQTDHHEETNNGAKRLEKLQLDFENQIAVELMKGGSTAEAVKHFLHASENGHVEAMNNLADCLYNGRGAKENKREAVRLWTQAANLGHSVAMYNLAVCFIGGEGISVDEREGLKWMRLAAKAGNADASFYLILKSMHEKSVEQIRPLLKHAIVDPEYRAEISSWVRDGVVEDSYLSILRDELDMS